MVIIKIIFTLFIFTSFSSCKEYNSLTQAGYVAISFLKWYENNKENLNKHDIIKGGFTDTTTNYEVDFTATEQYLNDLRKSNLVSEKYISDLRSYFQSANDSLKKYPQNDGPPQGFEFDLIMKDQDYMHITEHLVSAKIYSEKIHNAKATSTIILPNQYKLHFTLSRANNKWLVNSMYYLHSYWPK